MYAKRIKEIRKILGVSVAKMSEKIKIPARTITSYERGERTPSLEFLAHLCKILDVNPYWFLTGEGEMFNPKTPNFEQTKKDLLNEVRKMLKDEGIVK